MDIRASMDIESLATASISRTAKKVTKLPAVDVVRQVISASHERKDWMKKNVSSKEFILAEIPLSSVATLKSLNEKLDLKASLDDSPIVVDVNKNKAGQLSGRSKYYPPVIVIHGSGKHFAYRLRGKDKIKAWVGIDAVRLMRLQADSQFGAQELQSKLSEIMREKLGPKKNNIAGPYPYIVEVYPFEDYFIYQFEGKMWKQDYKCDVKKRVVTFDGDPEQVIQKYVDLDANMTPMDKAMKQSDVVRQVPNANTAKVLNGNLYNGTSPGSGVGPRVKMLPPSKSEIAGKI